MEKQFVKFLSAGTFVHEETVQETESWNVNQAVEMSRSIRERHGATPFGFYFFTRTRNEEDLDSKISASSGLYYLGGEILTLQEVKDRKDPKDSILISNMECNRWDKIIINTNSWKVI